MNNFLRLCTLLVLLWGCFLGIACKLWKVAVIDAAYYAKFIRSAHSLRSVEKAVRGQIRDRKGNVLAVTTTTIDLGVDPSVADVDKDSEKILQMSEILHLDFSDVLKSFQKEVFFQKGQKKQLRWKKIATLRNEEDFKAIKELKIKGVYGNFRSERFYTNESLASHVIGFVNKQNIPVCGIELFLDSFLRGQDGAIISEKDGKKREIAMFRESSIDPQNGSNVELTLDIALQDWVEESLKNTVEKFSAKSGVAIISDPVTGEILSLANFPTYNPNRYNEADPENLKNQAIVASYEPGSVFKIVASGIALEQGLISPYTVVDCSQGNFSFQGKSYSLPKDHQPFGKLTVAEALRKSSNRGLAQIGILLGKEKLYRAARAFGFGEKTGYGFDGEAAGLLFPPSRWDGLTITRLPMGHAVAVTALQMHQAMGVIASGGFLMKPKVVKQILDAEDEVILSIKPEVKRRVLSLKTANTVAKMLHHPNSATSTIHDYKISYKTGTTQKLINGKYSSQHHISSCSGFFPTETPRFLITVVIDDPHMKEGVAYGSRVAFPLFETLANILVMLSDPD